MNRLRVSMTAMGRVLERVDENSGFSCGFGSVYGITVAAQCQFRGKKFTGCTAKRDTKETERR